jgi:hypothetical protein
MPTNSLHNTTSFQKRKKWNKRKDIPHTGCTMVTEKWRFLLLFMYICVCVCVCVCVCLCDENMFFNLILHLTFWLAWSSCWYKKQREWWKR